MANRSASMKERQLSLPDASIATSSDLFASDLLAPFTTAAPKSSVSIIMHSMPVTECSAEENYCMVTRVEYSKAEEPTRNRLFWALERRCATACLDGCISIGDGMF